MISGIKLNIDARKLTAINTAISILLALVITVSTFTLCRSIIEERERQIAGSADTFINQFEQEIKSITDFMSACRSDASFITVVDSPSRAWSYQKTYINNVMSILSAAQTTFYAVDRFYLYSPMLGKIIGTSGYTSAEYWSDMDWIRTYVSANETISPPGELAEGWHAYRKFSIYVQNMLNGGKFIACVSQKNLAKLETFNKYNTNCHIIVTYNNGEYFASSVRQTDESIEKADYSKIKDGDIMNVGGISYRITVTPGKDFAFILLSDNAYVEKSLRAVSISSGIVVALAVCMLIALIFVNHNYSSGVRGALGIDEYDSVPESVHIRNLMSENVSLKRHELETVLRRGFRGEALNAYDADVVTQNYSEYCVVCAVLQPSDGKPAGRRLDEMVQFVCDTINAAGAIVDDYCAGFLLDGTDAEEAKSFINEFANALEGDYSIYTGVSDVWKKPDMIRSAYEQAHSCMLKSVVTGSDGQTGAFTALSEDDCVTITGALELNEVSFMRTCFESVLNKYRMTLPEMREFGRQVLRMTGAKQPDSSLFENCYNPDYMCGLLAETAAAASVKAGAQKESEYTNEMKSAVLEYINANYTSDLSLEAVADNFHVTAVYMSRWFKKANGVNFSVYLSTVRMKQAQQLLADKRNLKISEVSAMVGIQNALTFTRQFKAFSGMTPEQYRHQGDDVLTAKADDNTAEDSRSEEL